jgi:hypothetical protein
MTVIRKAVFRAIDKKTELVCILCIETSTTWSDISFITKQLEKHYSHVAFITWADKVWTQVTLTCVSKNDIVITLENEVKA